MIFAFLKLLFYHLYFFKKECMKIEKPQFFAVLRETNHLHFSVKSELSGFLKASHVMTSDLLIDKKSLSPRDQNFNVFKCQSLVLDTQHVDI